MVELSIGTGNNGPIQQHPYFVPMALRERVKEELGQLEAAGIIERSSSKWSSPTVPVRKPDGSIRICGDFRKLNAATTVEPYSIPRIDELLNKFGEATVLNKINLTKGFHQVKVKESDQEKLTIVTPFGIASPKG